MSLSPKELAAQTELADRRRAAVVEEYSQYVAKQDIFVGQLRAYRAGSPVPASNVVRHGYLINGLVISAEEAEKAREAEVKAEAEKRAAEEAEAVKAHEAFVKKQQQPAKPEKAE